MRENERRGNNRLFVFDTLFCLRVADVSVATAVDRYRIKRQSQGGRRRPAMRYGL